MVLFASRESDVCGVDYDYKVTGVNMRREGRLVLTTKESCGFHSNLAEDLVFGVDDVPLALDVGRFGRERFHFLEKTFFICCLIAVQTEGGGNLWR